MNIFGKILVGGIGWALGGPIGGLIGVAIGHSLDNNADNLERQGIRPGGRQTRKGDFEMSLLVLSAAVMKADGKVLKSELNFVKDFYTKRFRNPAHVKEYMLVLKDLLKKDIPLQDVCLQIRNNMQQAMRLELLHYLFAISQADGHVDKSEVNIIEQIASYLGLSQKDFESIKAMFYKDAGAAFKILEVNENASNDEIKKAYRKMALKYHPDRLSQLGPDYEKTGKEKFQKLQDAYETIKKERGFN